MCVLSLLFAFVCASVLTAEKFAELEDYYKPGQVECDLCHSREHVIPVARGKPSEALQMFVREGGQVKLGGCTFEALGYCTQCDHYISELTVNSQ